MSFPLQLQKSFIGQMEMYMDAARSRIPAANVAPEAISQFLERHGSEALDRTDQRIEMAERMVARMTDLQRVRYNIRIARAAFLIASDIIEENRT